METVIRDVYNAAFNYRTSYEVRGCKLETVHSATCRISYGMRGCKSIYSNHMVDNPRRTSHEVRGCKPHGDFIGKFFR